MKATRKEIWQDQYHNPVVMELIPLSGDVVEFDARVVVGFNSYAEARQEYPDAQLRPDRRYRWEEPTCRIPLKDYSRLMHQANR